MIESHPNSGDHLRPGLLLDRDGVIIENRDNYIRTWDDVVFCKGALDSLASLAKRDIKLAIITNQSAVGRGLVSRAAADEINQRLGEVVLSHGGRIDGTYMCPHRPDDGCECRKPRPGLILMAANELGLDLGSSILIGDAISDLEAGARAGVGRLALVRTGRGSDQAEKIMGSRWANVDVFDDLQEAIRILFHETE